MIENVNAHYDETELDKPLGGSETQFLFLVRELKKRKDIELTVAFMDEPVPDKIYDAVVTWRDPTPLFNFDHTKSKKNIAFFEDLPGPEVIMMVNQLALQGKLHKVVFLSHFQKEAFLRQCHLLDDNRHVIMLENGIDLDLFKPKVKKENAFIYASTPYRGLDILLKVWPRIYKELPDWELRVAGDIHMYDVSSNPTEINERTRELNLVGEKLYGQNIPGVKWLGGLKHSDLIIEMKKCKGLLFPSTFPETSCHVLNCALHAGASPIVSTAGGAISEKVCNGENGLLVPGDPKSQEFEDAFVKTTVDSVKSGRLERMNKLNENAYKGWGMERVTDRLVDMIFNWEKVEGDNVRILGICCTLRNKYKSPFDNLLWFQPYDLLTDDIKGLPIDQARNAACGMALYKGADWLLFLDDDNFVSSFFIMEALKRVEKYGADIVVGNYYYKDSDDYLVPMTRIVRNYDNKALTRKELEELTEEEINGPKHRFVMSGAGCLLISSKALKKLGRPWFRTLATMSGRHTGEDTYFFQEANRCGLKIWVAWDIPVAHVDHNTEKWYGRPEDIKKIRTDMKTFKEKILYTKGRTK
jgi:glycosyltransferase involved in cell wall biosynthesis